MARPGAGDGDTRLRRVDASDGRLFFARERRPGPILHVGVHKTATSWFQDEFYPALSGRRYLDRRLVRSTLLAGSPLGFDPAAARLSLGLDEAEPAIICEEDLSGILHNGGLLSCYVAKELASELHAVAPDGEVVIFVREQAALAASHYHQYLREGGTTSASRYLFPADYRHLGHQRPLKVPRFDFAAFEFDRLVAHYDRLFGRDRVHVFAFEQFRRDRAGFLVRFCAELGLEPPSETSLRGVNGAYRTGLIPVVRGANLFTRRAVADKTVLFHLPYWYTARKWLLERLNRSPVFGAVPSTERLLGDETCAWIRERFWRSNAALAERMGVVLGALGYATAPLLAPARRPIRRPWLQWTKN
ncbi:hypothetical protein HMF7854_03305 [Sphingomonas ginkgonis]|uniref:Sulfotransferase family protein n=1 Tax=Sphingomonas ginkgonis TaxID=2315330 RepID=A0A429V7K4_9SPHN|nr:hypothetical protein [Sphingomonas ginkgonis]RST29961.1 hypothetical protein HMF7854_03305 [Sphingomonas ginkgonis]